jgi:DNA-3-methyladenine glycosylase
VSALSRSALRGDVLTLAPRLLGSVLEHHTGDGPVAIRLVEVEAYDGESDPGSHAYKGKTARNAVMFGDAGLAYVYFTYGMHWCMNLVCGPAGRAAAILLRAGAVVEGADLARVRRGDRVSERDLARGPARLCQALGVDGTCNGADLLAGGPLRLLARPAAPAGRVRAGPRVGVSAGATRPWRFWLDGEHSVSTYRAHTPRRRPAPSSAAPTMREAEDTRRQEVGT